jgi:hypothetical protein
MDDPSLVFHHPPLALRADLLSIGMCSAAWQRGLWYAQVLMQESER